MITFYNGKYTKQDTENLLELFVVGENILAKRCCKDCTKCKYKRACGDWTRATEYLANLLNTMN